MPANIFGMAGYWARSAGLPAYLTWVTHRLKEQAGIKRPLVEVKPRQAAWPVAIRRAGSVDIGVFDQIFLEEEYAALKDLPSPRLIFDLGANVGYASVYFLNCFPQAKVIAVEPDPRNFEMCRRNLAPYGDRAQVLLGAVWSRRCQLELSQGTFGDGREWATEVREAASGTAGPTVEAWTVPSLLELCGNQQIDLLKVDIEGSEREVFRPEAVSWLPMVKNICIELHGPECEAVFNQALSGFAFDRSTSGELTIARNLRTA